jgi:protein subunit release factor A
MGGLVMIDPNDLRVEVISPHRQGGQHVAITATPIKVTHIPTGTTVQLTCRSQHKAKLIAIEMIEWALASNSLI